MYDSNVSKELLLSLRHCTYHAFRLIGKRKSLIEVVNKVSSQEKVKNPFAQEKLLQLPLHTVINDYTDNPDYSIEELKAFTSPDHFGESKCVYTTTLCNLIRANDILIIEWIRNNNSQWSRRLGIEFDHCHLKIFRPGKKPHHPKYIGKIDVGYTVTDPSNHNVRMISHNHNF